MSSIHRLNYSEERYRGSTSRTIAELQYVNSIGPRPHIPKKELQKIFNYLKKPISSGIWLLEGEWLEKAGITPKIIE
jgi:hypothetical protein